MPDTPLDRSQLETALGDNATEAITPQVMRNWLASQYLTSDIQQLLADKANATPVMIAGVIGDNQLLTITGLQLHAVTRISISLVARNGSSFYSASGSTTNIQDGSANWTTGLGVTQVANSSDMQAAIVKMYEDGQGNITIYLNLPIAATIVGEIRYQTI